MGHTKCVQNVMLVSQNAQLNCLASVLIEHFKSRLIDAIGTGAIVVAGVGTRGQPLQAF